MVRPVKGTERLLEKVGRAIGGGHRVVNTFFVEEAESRTVGLGGVDRGLGVAYSVVGVA